MVKLEDGKTPQEIALEQDANRAQTENDVTETFMHILGLNPNTKTATEEIDPLEMVKQVVKNTTPVPEVPEDPRVALRKHQEEMQKKAELASTERFLKAAGIDVNQQPEPKRPDVLQSLKESKDMIGMFQEVNGAANNPDVYYHQQDGKVNDLLDPD
jgi:hypothetical protein